MRSFDILTGGDPMARTRFLAAAAAALLTAAAAPAHAGFAQTPDEVFSGIRPGVALIAGGELCTANFVFQTTGNAFDPAQQLYIGTAQHCVHYVGEPVRARVKKPVTGEQTEIALGSVEVIGVGGMSDDFALVRIDPAWNSWVSPSLAYWGGPTAADTAASVGTPVVCIGHPLTQPDLPRTGVVVKRTPDYVTWSCPDVSGDSGGPVTTLDGLALGEVSTLTSGITNGPSVGLPTGPTIQSMLRIGGHPLATCASRTPWTDPGCPA